MLQTAGSNGQRHMALDMLRGVLHGLTAGQIPSVVRP